MSWLGRRFPGLRHRDFLLLLADRLIAPGAMAFSIVGVSFAVLDGAGRRPTCPTWWPHSSPRAWCSACWAG